MLGDKIKQLRVSQGLNQTEFAKKLFVTPGAVSQWETGRTVPDTGRLIEIANTFSIPLDYFSEKQYTEAELITQQVLNKLEKVPKTAEARIVSGGMDKMPKDQREKILSGLSAMFPHFFEEEDDNEG